jgi:hypothetical protein
MLGLLGRGIGPSQGHYLLRAAQHRKMRTHTPMPRAGSEPTIPVFERSKTVGALDRTAIGSLPNKR